MNESLTVQIGKEAWSPEEWAAQAANGVAVTRWDDSALEAFEVASAQSDSLFRYSRNGSMNRATQANVWHTSHLLSLLAPAQAESLRSVLVEGYRIGVCRPLLNCLCLEVRREKAARKAQARRQHQKVARFQC